MKRILALLLIALCLPVAAGPIGDQLRTEAAQLIALATQVDAEEAETCPVCPDPEEPGPGTVPDLSLLSNDAIPTAPITKPARGGSYTDPTYGTTITRDTLPADGGGTFTRHVYSRRQPWNADGSYYVTTSSGGYMVLYNASTRALIKKLPKPPGESTDTIWHPTNPKLLLHTGNSGSGGVWYWLNVDTLVKTTAFSLAGKNPFPTADHWWTRGEGTISADGTKIVLMAEKGETFLGLAAVEVATGRIIGSLAAGSLGRPDHVSISQSGRWAVPAWHTAAGTRAYNLTFTTYKQLHSSSTHSDLAVGPEGNDYYVYADYSDATGGWVRATNIDTMASFTLLDLYPGSGQSTAIHISGQAMKRPGWVTFSTYSNSSGTAKEYKKIMLAELKTGGDVFNVAHVRNTATGYWAEPHAVPNRDLTKIMFVQNLGSGQPESYEAAIDWE